MFTAEQVDFLQSGCGLIVGSGDADNAPRASRAWGLEVGEDSSVRVLLDAGEASLRDNLQATGRLSITGGNVLTLRMIQLKGRVVAVRPASAADRDVSQRYRDLFFESVKVVDSIPRHLMERLVPTDMVVVHLVVDEFFDQTPGPSAGRLLGRSEG